MKILHAGATGLVGRHTLSLLLADARITRVVAPTRRALPLPHPKLDNPIIDFDQMPEDAHWWNADAVICTLGTTIKQAGSQAAFRTVDLDYPLAIARLAHAHGAKAFVLNSAMGADRGSRIFYNRIKGELESALAQIGYPSLTFVRPGLIGGARDEFRVGERIATVALQVLAPVIPRRYRINPAERIAAALVDAAIIAAPGNHVVPSDLLT